MIVVWLFAHPFCVEVIVVLALCLTSCVVVVVLERGVVYSLPSCKFLSGGSLCGRSCVDIVKILLCEGGDVEQWLEPRTYLGACV